MRMHRQSNGNKTGKIKKELSMGVHNDEKHKNIHKIDIDIRDISPNNVGT